MSTGQEQKEPAYGLVSPEALRTLSGLAFFEAMLAGRIPQAPIAQTLGFQLTEVHDGRIVFAGAPGPAHDNPLGTVHGGYIATLLDSAMSCAVHATLLAGQGYTTLELKVNFVRPVTVESGRLRAEGQIVHPGRRVATAAGRLVDEQDRLYAHGTATCLIFSLE